MIKISQITEEVINKSPFLSEVLYEDMGNVTGIARHIRPQIEERLLEKVSVAAEWRKRDGLDFHIEVDGGITVSTAALSVAGGADVLVAGTSVFKAGDAAAEMAALRAAR